MFVQEANQNPLVACLMEPNLSCVSKHKTDDAHCTDCIFFVNVSVICERESSIKQIIFYCWSFEISGNILENLKVS